MVRLTTILLFGLLAGLWSFPVGAAQDSRIEVPLGDAPTRGPADAPVTMVEFIDFQ